MCSLMGNKITFSKWQIQEDIEHYILVIKHSDETKLTINTSSILYDGTTSLSNEIENIKQNFTLNGFSFKYEYDDGKISNTLFNTNIIGETKKQKRARKKSQQNLVASSDKGSGKFWLDNNNLTSASTISFNIIEKLNDFNISSILNLLPADIYIYIQKLNDSTVFGLFKLTNSSKTDNTTFFAYNNLTYIHGVSSFTHGDNYIISFQLGCSGNSLKNKNIPDLPTKPGKSYNLKYTVDTGSFTWDEK